jgi:tRNA (guanosine-2'-O-)-methyltransferase
MMAVMNMNPEKIITKLQDYVSPRRQQRIETVLDNRLMSIQVALEMPGDIHNAFAVIRSCEIFGIVKVHIIATEKTVSAMRPISKGAMDWVDIAFHDNIHDFLAEMNENNYRLAGAMPHTKSGIDVSEIPLAEPLCLLLGNEHTGLSAPAKKACHWHYQIPMFGMTASFNLSVAAAISLYETTQRKRRLLQKPGDLTLFSRKTLQAHYYLNSVNSRLVNALFPHLS